MKIIRKVLSLMLMLRNSTRTVRNSLRLFIVLLCIIMLVIMIQENTQEHPTSSQNEKRKISSYLNSVEYRGTNTCKNNAEVVIGVISSPTNFEERNAIRSSWGKELPSNWCLFFFVGKQGSTKVQKELDLEMKQKEDVIESSITDTYENLTIKVGMLFDWVSNNCQKSKYFIKVDDDVFINASNMKKFIEHCIQTNAVSRSTDPQCQFETIFVNQYKSISGKTLDYVAVGYVYESVGPDRDPKSKWYLDKATYPKTILPNFLSGTCYLITINLLPDIIYEATNIPLINLEDVYFTGLIMTSKMKLTLKNNEKWNNFRPWFDDPCYFQSLITAHGLKAHELKEITSEVNRLNPEYCNKSIVRNIYIIINKYLSYYIPRI